MVGQRGIEASLVQRVSVCGRWSTHREAVATSSSPGQDKNLSLLVAENGLEGVLLY